jgi:hypothetical protein
MLGGFTVRRLVVLCVLTLIGVVVAPSEVEAARTPNGTEYHAIAFPVREAVSYFDDFGGVRDHHGNDLMGARLHHLLAADDGTIGWLRSDGGGRSGNMLSLTGDDGWEYWYIHINNDTPGTDDGANPAKYRFAPGIRVGSKVKRGQFIAYMGDSGEAEPTAPHLHFEMHKPDDSYINPYTSLRLAQGAGANGMCALPNNPKAQPDASAGRGFWTLSKGGLVRRFGNVDTHGRPPAAPANAPYVAIAPTPTGEGYWVTDAIGRVRAFGDARTYGGTSSLRLDAPIIGITPTASGRGYWLLAKDGGIFSFGNAKFQGSTGGMKLHAPVISMASTAGGRGYWLLASDGGIFTFGDARFHGSTGGMKLTSPVRAMASTATGRGYWLMARDGGIFGFGDAKYHGSVPGKGWCPGATAVSIARTRSSGGYWIMLDDGRVLTFGDAKAWGEPASVGSRPIMLVAAP